MTIFSEPNRDAITVAPEAAATGPRVGFLESFQASVDAQMRTSAQFGIEYFMQDLDWRQTRAMIEAGVPNPPQLILEMEGAAPGESGRVSIAQMMRNDSGYYEDFIPERSRPYLNAARMHSGENVGDTVSASITAYDARIQELREQYPQLALMTSAEMWDRVRSDAQAAERLDQNQRRTWGGMFGSLAGGMLSSLHPGTDPLNFYTLGFGGAGRSALQRIAVQGGGQGLVEGINQVTGVQEERRLLGLSHGIGDALTRVGYAAAGGAALQGLGEAARYGFRRWFRDAPTDPAPPVPERPVAALEGDIREAARVARVEQNPATYLDYMIEDAPLSGLRAGQPRIRADLNDMTRQLDSWDAGPVASIRPRTPNAAYPEAASMPRLDTAAFEQAWVHNTARAIDPQTFGRYDRLIETQRVLRAAIQETQASLTKDVKETLNAMRARISELLNQHQDARARDRPPIMAQIREVEKDRRILTEYVASGELPEVASLRRELLRADEQMRDLAPLIGRAYAQARGEWGADAADIDAAWHAYRNGRNDVQPVVKDNPIDYDTAVQLEDRAPILRRVTPDTERATAIETASAIVKREMETLDEAMEAYRATMRAALAENADGKLTIAGREFDLDGDRIYVPNEDGTGSREVSIRELLDEVREADYETEAITTCSILRRS